MKYFLFLFTAAIGIVRAQVPQTVVVEHFTNTLCSICANRNPGFYTNLASHPDVLHIAYHPSSPYSACIFNQHNVSENDGRTNYYGIYGGTPRLVVQGNIISTGANYSASALFDTVSGHTAPLLVRVKQWEINTDSARLEVVIRDMSGSFNWTAYSVFIGIAEEPILYAAPNGENLHHDVFRKALTPVNGNALSSYTVTGDSIVISTGFAYHAGWTREHIFGYAIVQHSTTRIAIQAGHSQTASVSGLPEENDPMRLLLQNNVVSDYLVVLSDEEGPAQIYDIQGRLAESVHLAGKGSSIAVQHLSPGHYVLRAGGKAIRFIKQF